MSNNIIAKAKKIKSTLVKKPKLVNTKGLIKKAKKIKNKTNIVTPMINIDAGCTPVGFGVSASEKIVASEIISKAKGLIAGRGRPSNLEDSLYNIIYNDELYIEAINNDTKWNELINLYDKFEDKIESLRMFDTQEIYELLKDIKTKGENVIYDKKFKTTIDETLNTYTYKTEKQNRRNYSWTDEMIKKTRSCNNILKRLIMTELYNYIESTTTTTTTTTTKATLEMIFNNPKEAIKNINNNWLTIRNKTIKDATDAEKKISDLIEGSSVSGNKTAYDLIDENGYIAEVKYYPNLETPITLGKEGNLTQFKEINYIINVLNYLQEFINVMKEHNNLIVFKGMLNDVYNKFKPLFVEKIDDKDEINKAEKILEYIEENIVGSNNKKSIVWKILNSKAEKIEDWKQLDYIYELFRFVIDEIFKNDCEYVKLINKGTIYVAKQSSNGNLIINTNKNDIDIKCEKMSKEENIQAEQKVKSTVATLRNKLEPLMGYENQGQIFVRLQANISKQLSDEFTKKHPLIIVNSSTGHKPLVLGIFKKVVFSGIGGQRGGVVILPDVNDPSSAIA